MEALNTFTVTGPVADAIAQAARYEPILVAGWLRMVIAEVPENAQVWLDADRVVEWWRHAGNDVAIAVYPYDRTKPRGMLGTRRRVVALVADVTGADYATVDHQFDLFDPFDPDHWDRFEGYRWRVRCLSGYNQPFYWAEVTTHEPEPVTPAGGEVVEPSGVIAYQSDPEGAAIWLAHRFGGRAHGWRERLAEGLPWIHGGYRVEWTREGRRVTLRLAPVGIATADLDDANLGRPITCDECVAFGQAVGAL